MCDTPNSYICRRSGNGEEKGIESELMSQRWALWSLCIRGEVTYFRNDS